MGEPRLYNRGYPYLPQKPILMVSPGKPHGSLATCSVSHLCLGILKDGWLGLRCVSSGQQREESQALPDVEIRKDPEGGPRDPGPQKTYRLERHQSEMITGGTSLLLHPGLRDSGGVGLRGGTLIGG